MTLIAAIVLGVLVLVAVQTLLNVRMMPRLADAARARGASVAVLIPARNEAAGIARSVAAWLACLAPGQSLVVYDDASADGTGEVARAAGNGDARLSVIAGPALPSGWRGKPHACHRLRAATDAEILLFVDADVVPQGDAVARTAGALASSGAGALSALPRHGSPRLLLHALVGLQRWAALVTVPWWLERWRGVPMVVNGQFIAIRAAVYDATGGFAAVRGSLAEDVALGRHLAAAGHRVAFLDGDGILSCQPYASFRELWAGNVRNLHAALLGSAALALLAAVTLVLLHVGPVVALLAGPGLSPCWPWVAMAAVGLALLPRWLCDRGGERRLATTLLHPVAVCVLAAMILVSVHRARSGGRVEWRGRLYPAGDDTAP